MYTKQLLLDLNDLPFEGGYIIINNSFKDEFGNNVKHIAQYLAKLGLKKVINNG